MNGKNLGLELRNGIALGIESLVEVVVVVVVAAAVMGGAAAVEVAVVVEATLSQEGHIVSVVAGSCM